MQFDFRILMNIWKRDVTRKFISYVIFKACSEEAQIDYTFERTLVLEKGPVGFITWSLFFLGSLH